MGRGHERAEEALIMPACLSESESPKSARDFLPKGSTGFTLAGGVEFSQSNSGSLQVEARNL